MWALGVCLFVMVCAKYPFKCNPFEATDCEKMFNKMMKRNTKNRYEITEETKTKYSPACIKMTGDLIEPAIKIRINARNTLQHSWLMTPDK